MSTTFYDHWRDVPESAWRWPNFSPAEIACRGTGKMLINEPALDACQALRDRLGKPLIVRSAYRSGPLARGIYGPFNGWLMTVTSLAVGPERRLFAADFYNDCIQKFAPDGTFLTDFGGKGTGPNRSGHAIAVAEDGSVFIADFLNNRIQKWRPRR